jgi:hypothetical protein
VVSAWPPGKCWQVVIGWIGWRRVTVNASPRGCRINQQWRICFVWSDAGPKDVEIVDYH